MENMAVRKRLRQWRLIDEEYSATEAAILLDVSRQHLWRIEQGTHLPGPELAERIERVTGIPAGEWRKGK